VVLDEIMSSSVVVLDVVVWYIEMLVGSVEAMTFGAIVVTETGSGSSVVCGGTLLGISIPAVFSGLPKKQMFLANFQERAIFALLP
jgi:hypothetical protein